MVHWWTWSSSQVAAVASTHSLSSSLTMSPMRSSAEEENTQASNLRHVVSRVTCHATTTRAYLCATSLT